MEEAIIAEELNLILEKYIGSLNTEAVEKLIRKDIFEYLKEYNLEKCYMVEINTNDVGDMKIQLKDIDENN